MSKTFVRFARRPLLIKVQHFPVILTELSPLTTLSLLLSPPHTHNKVHNDNNNRKNNNFPLHAFTIRPGAYPLVTWLAPHAPLTIFSRTSLYSHSQHYYIIPWQFAVAAFRIKIYNPKICPLFPTMNLAPQKKMWFHLHAATKAFEDVNFDVHSPTTIEGNIETRHRGCGVCSIWWLEINLLDDFNNISSHVWHVILFRRVFIRSWFAACRVDNIHYVHHFTIRWTVIILSHNSNILYNTIPWLLFRCWYYLYTTSIYLGICISALFVRFKSSAANLTECFTKCIFCSLSPPLEFPRRRLTKAPLSHLMTRASSETHLNILSRAAKIIKPPRRIEFQHYSSNGALLFSSSSSLWLSLLRIEARVFCACRFNWKPVKCLYLTPRVRFDWSSVVWLLLNPSTWGGWRWWW